LAAKSRPTSVFLLPIAASFSSPVPEPYWLWGWAVAQDSTDTRTSAELFFAHQLFWKRKWEPKPPSLNFIMEQEIL